VHDNTSPGFTRAERTWSKLCNEIRLARSARHPQIILFFGVVPIVDQRDMYMGIVHELIEGCTLEAHVAQRVQHNEATCTVTELRVLLHVAEAMNFLHSLKPAIVHRDLRPHSVLMETAVSPPRAKLFNFARASQRDEVLELHCPPDGYTAPEVANAEPCGRASDIFSFGGICAYVLCGEHPLQAMSEADIVPETSAEANLAIGHLATRCQHPIPTQRPNFREVYGLVESALRTVEE